MLVDEKSASASEVLAGAIKENQRGQLIGQQTFGKGVVQSLEKLGDGAGLLITVAQYLTPTGENIHKKGISPDQKIASSLKAPATADELQPQKDEVYLAAVKNLSKVIP